MGVQENRQAVNVILSGGIEDLHFERQWRIVTAD
jgi:hypothetical protein